LLIGFKFKIILFQKVFFTPVVFVIGRCSLTQCLIIRELSLVLVSRFRLNGKA